MLFSNLLQVWKKTFDGCGFVVEGTLVFTFIVPHHKISS